MTCRAEFGWRLNRCRDEIKKEILFDSSIATLLYQRNREDCAKCFLAASYKFHIKK